VTGQTRPGEDASPDLRKVHVALGERAYDILIGRGVVARAPKALEGLGARAAMIVSDDTVFAAHGNDLVEALANAGLRVSSVSVPPGEASKNFVQLQRVCGAILDARIERGDLVVALGGGVVGDLAGFAAAIVRRGIRFVQVPTSLLAQVDSSVGGKTGINAPQGKNLIGAFHQPSLVLADTALLDTLPLREIRAGYAETVKYGLINDPAFFDWCAANWPGIYGGGPEREHAVEIACRAKAAIVARDERETGDRALLNLGHTFGHALERVTGYDSARLIHGEAVALGIAQAFRFSVAQELCSGQDAVRVEAHLREAGLPTRLADIPGPVGSVDDLLGAMAQDKKVVGGALTFILARGIGASFIAKDVPAQDVRAFLAQETAGLSGA
jgi:3-dehydroquinate synthase